jgi:putative PIN family toxin of toxin-antitoxin system
LARLVLDTNVLVSALLKKGKPRELLFKIAGGGAQLILSREILEEFAGVINSPKIRKYVRAKDAMAFLRALGSMATMVEVKSKFKVIREDPSDDIVLRTAHDGKADYIVSGDKHLLSLRKFGEIEIVAVTQMLDLLKST